MPRDQTTRALVAAQLLVDAHRVGAQRSAQRRPDDYPNNLVRREMPFASSTR